MCKLSICITVKNRSIITIDDIDRLIFPNCVESLKNIFTSKDDVELVVTDWCSTDMPIESFLTTCNFPGYIHLINLKSKRGFSKGVGQNRAAMYAKSSILFFLDADILVQNRQIIEDGISYCNKGEVLYPKGWRRGDVEGKTGYNFTGVGNFFIRKDTFIMVGSMPEYWSWGFEDFEFQQKLEKHNIKFHQIGYNGFIHQYHPEELEWKNKETILTPDELKKQEQLREKYKKDIKIDEEADQAMMSLFAKSVIDEHKKSKIDNTLNKIKPIGTL